MSEPQRQPRGIPSGGQFAASERTESGVSLDGPSLDGSFFYPPVFHTAEEVVSFWSRVEVPDVVLARAERVYTETHDDFIITWPPVAWAAYGAPDWDAANPKPDAADVGATAEWEGRRRAAQADFEESLRDAMTAKTDRLDRRDVRPLVRAAAMLRTAVSDLPWEDYQQVSQHPIALTTGPTPVRQAGMESGLSAITTRFLDADAYSLDAPSNDEIQAQIVQTIARVTAQQNQLLDAAFGELTDNVGKVGHVVLDSQDPRARKRR